MYKFKILKLIILLATFLMMPFLVWAETPTITNVSGTIANGQILTIAGTNMVDETKAGWDENFSTYPAEYGFEDALYPYGFHLFTGGGDFPPYFDTTIHLMGNKSVAAHVYGRSGCSPNCGSASMSTTPAGNVSDMHVRWYARFNGNPWPDHYIKQLGFQPQSGALQYVMLNDGNGAVSYFDGNAYNPKINVNPVFQNNRWYCFEAETHNLDKSFKLWIDGKLTVTGTALSSVSASYLPFLIVNYSTVSAVADFYEWWDNFAYGENSRIYPSSTIEISGDGGITWKWQSPTLLSDTSIDVSVELPALTFANYKLRVINNLQENSAIYDLVSFSDSAPPATPAGLSVM